VSSVYSAENGCFIKTRPSGKHEPEWLNMVSNFNLTWKSACLEMLNYVRLPFPSSGFALVIVDGFDFSSRNARLVHSLRSERRQWFGGSGREKVWIIRIGSGRRGRLRKRRTISLTGIYSFFFSFVFGSSSLFFPVLANAMVCALSQGGIASSSYPTTSHDLLLSVPFCTQVDPRACPIPRAPHG